MSELLLSAIQAKIDEHLAAASARGIAFNVSMARYHLATGGKRLRALIPTQIFEALGKDPAEILPLSVAIELIHNATLVHDDLQDGDETRRGQPTVWKKYSPAQAINCGDALLYMGGDALLDLQIAPEKLVRLQRMIFRSVLQVIEGQSQEFILQDRARTEIPRWADYAAMTQGKTAALLGIPVGGALFCAGIDAEVCAQFEIAATRLGVLFQIQDDILDVYGDKGRDRVASDIYEGKISALVIEYCESDAAYAQKQRILQILQTPRGQTSSAMVDEVLAQFQRVQVLERARARIVAFQAELEANAELSVLPVVKNYLTALTAKFLEPISRL